MDRLPPYNAEAEEAVLGSLLIGQGDMLHEVEPILQPSDFFKEKGGWIYQAVLNLNKRESAIDFVTICDELEQMGKLDQAGGPAYVMSLINAVPTSLHAEHYAKIVYEHSVRRQLIQVAQDIVTLAYGNGTEGVEDLLAKAEQKLAKVGQRLRPKVYTVEDVLSGFWDELFEPTGKVAKRIFTGLPGIDGPLLGIESGRLLAMGAVPGTGKCLGKGTPVLMYDGTVKAVEEVVPGDLLMGPDSTPRMVGSTTSGWGPLYRVTPTKGDPYVVNDAHILSLKRTPTHGDDGCIVNMEVKDYLALGSGWKPRYKGWRTGVDWPEQELPISPYILGLWLGDGSSHKPNFYTMEPEIVEELRGYAKLNGLQVNEPRGGNSGLATEYALVNGKNVNNPFLTALQELGIYQNKHIPHIYLANSRKNRLELLAGLLDTDGWYDKRNNGYEITQKNKELATQIAFLARSLGFAAYPTACEKTCTNNGATGTYYRMHISGNVDEIPVRVVRKKATARKQVKDVTVTGIRVEPIGEGEYYGFTIDKDRLFLLGDFTVTHNTAVALNIVRGAIKNNKGEIAVLYFHPEQPREEITQLLWCSGTTNVPPIRLKAMMTPKERRQEFVKAEAFINGSTQTRGIGQMKAEYLAADPTPEEIEALTQSQAEIDGVPIILEDPAGQNIHQVLATIRRVRYKLPDHVFLLVVFDGAHLIPGMGEGNRTQELAAITRNLKIAAQKLVTADGQAAGAIIANTQLNREIFQNVANRVYLMKHLKDSGCLAGDSLVYLPETGERVPIKDLVGKSGFSVLALNTDTWKMEPRRVAACFTTGIKPVFRLTTRLGRSIRATANHQFLTINGWKRLDQLKVGEHIATPRTLPDVGTQSLSDARLALLGHLIGDGCVLPSHSIQYTTGEPGMAYLVAQLATEVFGDNVRPYVKKERNYDTYLAAAYRLTHGRQNPVSKWFRELGIFGLRSYEKRVPDVVFTQPNSAIARFLRHLWSTDGTIKLQSVYPAVHYTSSSRQLAGDVQHLLLRLGINARLKGYSQGQKGRDQQRVTVSGREDLLSFLSLVGAVSESHKRGAAEIAEHLRGRNGNTNRDVIPSSVWRTLVLPNTRMTQKQLAESLGVAYNGTARYRTNLSRERAMQVAEVTGNAELAVLAQSDVYWDTVVSIEPDGEEAVYDLSVEGLHNFVANDITVHNSWEADSDVIIFIDRGSVFSNNGNETKQWDPFKIIVAKNRQTSKLFTAYFVMNTSTMMVRGRDLT